MLGSSTLAQAIDRVQAAQEIVGQDERIAKQTARAAHRFDAKRRALRRARTRQRATVAQLASSRSRIKSGLARRQALLGSIRTQVAKLQWNATRPISRGELQPGDLVFFDRLGHVGIYIGGNEFIHAPHTDDVVRVTSLGDGWYASRFDGARRVP